METEFEDEDFLLAVKDVEKQAVDPAPANSRCLRPLLTGLRVPNSSLTPSKNLGILGSLEAMSPVLQMQSYSRLKSDEGSCPSKVKSNPLLPLSTSFNAQNNPVTLPAECKSSCTSGVKFKFVNRHPAVFPLGADLCEEEIDNDLALAACMDHEESDTLPKPEFFRSNCGTQEQMRDNSAATAKKPRVVSSAILSKPVGLQTSKLQRAQEESLMGDINHLQPMETVSKLTLRPTAMGSYLSQTNVGVTSNKAALSNSNCQVLKSLQTSLGKRPADCNKPCLPSVRPCSSLSVNIPPRLTKPCISSCSVARTASSSAQLLTPYVSLGTPAETPSAIPNTPCSTAAAGNSQTPVVTNHLVRLVTAANKTPQPIARASLRAKTRRFPGPAGILPHQPEGKNLEEILIATPQTPTHGALAKLRTEEMPTSQQSIEEEFERGPWVAMKTELELDERDPSCFLRTYSVVMVLRKAALKQIPKNKVPNMAVMIKSLMRTNVDAGAVFKDPTGEMQGTIHRLLLEEKESEFKAGSVLLLKQVGVFSPSHRNHYLNVTPSNLVKIYPPGLSAGKLPRLHQENQERMEPVLSQVVSEVQKKPHTNALTSLVTADCRHEEGHVMDKNCSQHVLGSSKGAPWTPVPGICGGGKSVLNVPSPNAERADSDDLDQLLGELPDDFFSNLDELSSL
ncbi:homologous recombination OB-fold protein isoform X2 [Varanus komodoensis]|nr:homologous recombination OB-fold protein isoform X2 [Varanus komodoensis]